jgi:hypothetical protein
MMIPYQFVLASSTTPVMVLTQPASSQRESTVVASKPMTTPRKANITVKPIDLVRRMAAYDGIVNDWNATVKVPQGIPLWNFTLAEVDRQNFSQLEKILGAENFQTIMETQGYIRPKNELMGYRGEDNLPMHYYVRKTNKPGTYELILVSFGEYQPQRWIANIEGFWHVTGVKF